MRRRKPVPSKVIAVLTVISHSYSQVIGDYSVLAKEIERKFLVFRNEWRNIADAGTRIVQAYICLNEERNLRVRILNGTSAKLTIKIGQSALVRDEYEYDIPLADAFELVQHRMGNLVEKMRYRVPFHGFVFEVDVFAGDLAGLVVAEVELTSATDNPQLPDWLGPEATGNPLYSNQSLALNGCPKEPARG